MSSLVVDASALVEHLLDPHESFEAALTADLHVPALCDVEVLSALRRLLRMGRIDRARALEAVDDHMALPLRRHGHGALLGRMLELADNFSAYDSAYVALAEMLGAALLTGDRRLAAAVGRHLALDVRTTVPKR